jgi:beta-xylosidase
MVPWRLVTEYVTKGKEELLVVICGYMSSGKWNWPTDITITRFIHQTFMQFAFVLLLILGVSSSLAAPTYNNPVVPGVDAPDPGAVYDQSTGAYYAATTSQGAKDSYPIRISKDLATWTVVGHIFPADSPTRPRWAVTDFWAPELHLINGRYVAYFTARDTTGRLCIGAAYSAGDILGPFVDSGSCFVRDPNVGMIDSHAFQDPATGSWYLIWKEDGNGAVPQIPTPIWCQQLSADGLTLVGDRYPLITNDLPWEGALVEAPWMVFNQGYYFLFYSANAFYNASYAVGVARARSMAGPFEKFPSPMVHSNKIFAGPGHCSVLALADDPSNFVMIYHSWMEPNVGGPGDDRMIMIDPIYFDPETSWPFMATASPSVGPQPIPM